MRKTKLIILATVVCGMVSCGNDSDGILSERIGEVSGEADVNNIISLDSLMFENRQIYASWSRSPTSSKTRSSSLDLTVYGYTSSSTTGNRTISMSKKIASLMGIPKQYYVAENVTAKYLLTIDGLSLKKVRFSTNDSPNCGLYPDYSSEELEDCGYSYMQKGDDVTLSTVLIHIISDTYGRAYNRWYPCSPTELQWNYNLFTAD